MLRLLSFAAILVAQADAYDPIPRWGQAAALVNDALYIYGGKSDPYNSYSYTSAPWTNDLFSLSLSSSFSPTSPDWTYLAGASNASSPQLPAPAWHTLSALNTTHLLLFGGNTGPSAPTVLPSLSDSAGLLALTTPPRLALAPQGWANEPQRRMRHTAATADGRVWLVGGEHADGSGSAYGDHWVFDPAGPGFTPLPSAGAPPDVYGHAAVVLHDGRMLVFGGYSPSRGALLPFTDVWTLDTTQSSPQAWGGVQVDVTAVPQPRLGFAATLLTDGRVLVHGGTDADMQNDFSDGWILDTNVGGGGGGGIGSGGSGSGSGSGSESGGGGGAAFSNSNGTMSWQRVDALDQLGGRRDHFAIAVNNQVLFGFGYGTSAPADSSIHIFNVDSGSFQSSFQPMSSTPPYQTLPLPSPTGSPGSGSGSGSGSGQGSGGGSGNGGGGSGNGGGGGGGDGGGGQGSGSGNGSNGGGGDGSGGENGSSPSGRNSGNHTAAIAVGSILGALGLLACAGLGAYYVRHHQRPHGPATAFSPLAGSEDEESPGADRVPRGIPMAGGPRGAEKGRYAAIPAVLSAVGLKRKGQQGGTGRERRDMLADEDRTFDWEMVGGQRVRRDGSGGGSSFASGSGSAWSRRSSLARAKTLAGIVSESLASLKALGSGRRNGRSREPTGSSAGAYGPDWEKYGNPDADPFEDEVGLMASALAQHPRGGDASGSEESLPRGVHGPYSDPFADTEQVEVLHDAGEEHASVFEGGSYYTHLHDVPPHPALRTALPPTADFIPLSPLIEQASSKNSLSLESSAHSHPSSANSRTLPSIDTGSGTLSRSSASHELPRSPRPSSILDAGPSAPPSQPMRRSDSWWARFARTPLLERARSGEPAAAHDALLEFRDPNPPPRLITIEESGHSPDSPGARVQRRGAHSRSVSSLQTTNTDTLERVGGTMEVVQRDATFDSQGTGASATAASSPAGEFGAARPLQVVRMESEASQVSQDSAATEARARASPDTAGDLQRAAVLAEPLPAGPRSPGVADRVRMFERRLSREGAGPPPPTNTRSREERAGPRPVVRYGLVPKTPLFVANPDRGAG